MASVNTRSVQELFDYHMGQQKFHLDEAASLVSEFPLDADPQSRYIFSYNGEETEGEDLHPDFTKIGSLQYDGKFRAGKRLSNMLYFTGMRSFFKRAKGKGLFKGELRTEDEMLGIIVETGLAEPKDARLTLKGIVKHGIFQRGIFHDGFTYYKLERGSCGHENEAMYRVRRIINWS